MMTLQHLGRASLENLQQATCSCGCCHSARRVPSEIDILPNGRALNLKCVPASGASDACPSQCRTDADNPTGISGVLDTSVFCMHSCKPRKLVGALCLGAQPALAGPVHDGSGDPASTTPGDDDADPVRLLSPSARVVGNPGAASSPGSTGDPAAEAERRALLAAESQRRKEAERRARRVAQAVAAARLRARASAALVMGSATAQRVAANLAAVGQSSDGSAQVHEAVAPLAAGLDASKVASKSLASAATERAATAERAVRTSNRLTKAIARKATALAEQLIHTKALDAAAREAEAYAKWMGWGKPANAQATLAFKAADPQMQYLAAAVQQASEFGAYAKELRNHARSLERKALALQPHMEAFEQHRDELGLAVGKHEARLLTRRAVQLRNQADGLDLAAKESRTAALTWKDAIKAVVQRTPETPR